MKRIVIDLMGSDKGEEEIFLGALSAAKALPDYCFALVGNVSEKNKRLLSEEGLSSRIEIIDAPVTFLNTDSPMEIVKGRDETSLVTSLKRLAEDDDCIALLSFGSTGGLLVGSIFRLGLLSGLKMPALASHAYDKDLSRFIIVDCGANLDCEPKTLLRFAHLGSALSKSFAHKENPRVGLLNVGKEKGKGNALIKATYPLFEGSDLNFVGSIEGDDIFDGMADVIVADGFVGNVLIKSADHLSKVVLDMVRKELPEIADERGIYDRIRARFNYNEEGAAVVLGSRKICLKGHGTSSKKTVLSACLQADELYRGHLIEEIKKALGE